MNKVILIGRLTKTPELKSTQSGRNVCQFSIAVNRNYTNANGEREADFINCVVWDKQAENLVNYQNKGNQIAVEGRIQTRNYEDNSGKKVYVTEVLVNNISYLDSKKESTTNLPEPPKQEEEKLDPYTAFGDSIEVAEEQQELPFDESSLPF